MHEADFELLSRVERPDGLVELSIRIQAAGLTRRYLLDPATGNLRLDDAPLRVGGHDMTSIIGKRVREWLAGGGGTG